MADENLPDNKRIYWKRLMEIGPELARIISKKDPNGTNRLYFKMICLNLKAE